MTTINLQSPIKTCYSCGKKLIRASKIKIIESPKDVPFSVSVCKKCKVDLEEITFKNIEYWR